MLGGRTLIVFALVSAVGATPVASVAGSWPPGCPPFFDNIATIEHPKCVHECPAGQARNEQKVCVVKYKPGAFSPSLTRNRAQP